MHYTECPLYSLLQVGDDRADASGKAQDPHGTDELVEMKLGAFGFSLNVKSLITRFAHWWLRRIGKGRDA